MRIETLLMFYGIYGAMVYVFLSLRSMRVCVWKANNNNIHKQ